LANLDLVIPVPKTKETFTMAGSPHQWCTSIPAERGDDKEISGTKEKQKIRNVSRFKGKHDTLYLQH
jgi:hypothetical protein